ncbi:MAG: hypothetical protein JWQ02_4196 [Capsulimonas sp.]|nr:hypothetical protein [Capsulimonas sp.]
MGRQIDAADLAEQHVEQYLGRVSGYLHGADPQIVNETLEEMRLHLRACCEELVHRGYSADQAIRMSVQRFGSSSKVGRSLAWQLAADSIFVKLYCALTLSRYVKFFVIFWRTPMASDSDPVVTAAQPWLIPALTLMLLWQIITTLTATRPRSPARVQQNILSMQRDLINPKYLNPTGFLRYLYLTFLLLIGIECLHHHIYRLGILCILEAIEFAFIRTAANRILGRVSA